MTGDEILAMVRDSYVAVSAEHSAEFPSMPPAPAWEELPPPLRDLMMRMFFRGGKEAIDRFHAKMRADQAGRPVDKSLH